MQYCTHKSKSLSQCSLLQDGLHVEPQENWEEREFLVRLWWLRRGLSRFSDRPCSWWWSVVTDKILLQRGKICLRVSFNLLHISRKTATRSNTLKSQHAFATRAQRTYTTPLQFARQAVRPKWWAVLVAKSSASIASPTKNCQQCNMMGASSRSALSETVRWRWFVVWYQKWDGCTGWRWLCERDTLAPQKI